VKHDAKVEVSTDDRKQPVGRLRGVSERIVQSLGESIGVRGNGQTGATSARRSRSGSPTYRRLLLRDALEDKDAPTTIDGDAPPELAIKKNTAYKLQLRLQRRRDLRSGVSVVGSDLTSRHRACRRLRRCFHQHQGATQRAESTVAVRALEPGHVCSLGGAPHQDATTSGERLRSGRWLVSILQGRCRAVRSEDARRSCSPSSFRTRCLRSGSAATSSAAAKPRSCSSSRTRTQAVNQNGPLRSPAGNPLSPRFVMPVAKAEANR